MNVALIVFNGIPAAIILLTLLGDLASPGVYVVQSSVFIFYVALASTFERVAEYNGVDGVQPSTPGRALVLAAMFTMYLILLGLFALSAEAVSIWFFRCGSIFIALLFCGMYLGAVIEKRRLARLNKLDTAA